MNPQKPRRVLVYYFTMPNEAYPFPGGNLRDKEGLSLSLIITSLALLHYSKPTQLRDKKSTNGIFSTSIISCFTPSSSPLEKPLMIKNQTLFAILYQKKETLRLYIQNRRIQIHLTHGRTRLFLDSTHRRKWRIQRHRSPQLHENCQARQLGTFVRHRRNHGPTKQWYVSM